MRNYSGDILFCNELLKLKNNLCRPKSKGN